MHNISKQTVQDLAAEIVELCLHADTGKILDKTRELYEQSVLLHFQRTEEIPTEKITETINLQEIQVPEPILDTVAIPTEINENIENTPDEIEEKIESVHFIDEPESKVDVQENPQEIFLSVEDRIKQIMENAGQHAASVTPDLPEITELFIEEKVVVTKEPEPIAETKKSMPQISREEEMGESIPADIAADMFERADKINTVKKSLNDRLSQQQLQIGLNDRIAFVKHLFDGNLADFNRVLSQLNSFESEAQAKQFINTIVKVDYNWTEKLEYEERLMQLIERKFL